MVEDDQSRPDIRQGQFAKASAVFHQRFKSTGRRVVTCFWLPPKLLASRSAFALLWNFGKQPEGLAIHIPGHMALISSDI